MRLRLCSLFKKIQLPETMETSKNNFLLAVLTTSQCFTTAECAQIVELSVHHDKQAGIARGEFGYIRDSKVCFLSPNNDTAWVFSKLQTVIAAANQQYRFHLTGFQEPLQVAEYQSGGYYDWHLDIGTDVTSARKLSASVQLSDGESYEGGDLEFLNVKTPNLPRSIGSIIIFPSYLPHRVRPVTRGIRRSLVAWIHGKPFS